MNRKQLTEALADSTERAPAEVRAILDALLGTRESTGVLVTALLEVGRVQLAGFGTFEVRERPARSGHNPRTGERIEIAASVTAAFKPATTFRQHLQAAYDHSRRPEPPETR